MQIEIGAPGDIIVTVPVGLAEPALLAFVASKAAWMAQKLDAATTSAPAAPVVLEDGMLLPYLGVQHRLEIGSDIGQRKPLVVRDAATAVIRLCGKPAEPEAWRIALVGWYREQAAAIIGERVRLLGVRAGVKARQVRVRDQKRRWGSCSASGNLSINWRCIMAPLEIVDYIVVHELCHLVVLDHSRLFWEQVRTILPDYASSRRWLKHHRQALLGILRSL